jgi:hypothetical protein
MAVEVGSGLWAAEDFVFVHKDDYQGDDEEGDHRPAQETEVAGDVQRRNVHLSEGGG